MSRAGRLRITQAVYGERFLAARGGTHDLDQIRRGGCCIDDAPVSVTVEYAVSEFADHGGRGRPWLRPP